MDSRLVVVGLIAMVPALTIAVTLLSIVAWMRYKDFRWLEGEIEEIKAWLVDRAVTASLLVQLGQIGSPWRLNTDKVAIFQPFEEELLKSYEIIKKKYIRNRKILTDRNLYWEISKLFSRRFAAGICLENRMLVGESLLGACYVAKGGQPLDLDPIRITVTAP